MPIPQLDVPDIAGNYLRGMQAKAFTDQQAQQNALAGALQQYGAAASQGDQNALAQLARYDPQMVSGLMGDQQQMKLRTSADQRAATESQHGMAYDDAQLDMARKEAAAKMAEHAAKMDEFQRQATADKMDRFAAGLTQVKTPEEFDAYVESEGHPEMKGHAKDQQKIIAQSLGVKDALALNAPPDPLTDDGKRRVDEMNGYIDPNAPPKPDLMSVPEGNAVIDKNNPEGGPVFSLPKSQDPAALFKDEQDLRTQYDKLTSNFRAVHDAYGRITATKGETPQADMSLIFQFMKMLDPGSTVREGEYAAAEQTRGVPDTVIATYNKILTGQTLTPQQRDEFRNQAQNLYKRAEQDNGATSQQYRKLAEQYKFDPNRVVVPYGSGFDGGAPPAPAGAPAGAEEPIEDVLRRYGG